MTADYSATNEAPPLPELAGRAPSTQAERAGRFALGLAVVGTVASVVLYALLLAATQNMFSVPVLLSTPMRAASLVTNGAMLLAAFLGGAGPAAGTSLGRRAVAIPCGWMLLRTAAGMIGV